MSKVYNIIAGVNGAGKTSLYSIINRDYELGERVNIDEIVKKYGDWQDTLLQIKAGRAAIHMINEFIEKGITFHQETTLPGATIIKQIKKAKENGFEIRLFFIGIDDVNVAIQRVHKRIAMGGHGIDDSIIEKRYKKIPESLKSLLPLCDNAILYDNTLRFRHVAFIKDNVIQDYDPILPKWFNNLISDVRMVQKNGVWYN